MVNNNLEQKILCYCYNILGLLITQRNIGFFYFQYDFGSSRSKTDLLTLVSDRIARDFNGFATTQAVSIDIIKAFHRVNTIVSLTDLRLMEFRVRYLASFSLF